MRSSNLKQLNINEQIEAFFANGGAVKTADYGNAVNENDGETWQQQNRRRWAARQEREAAK